MFAQPILLLIFNRPEITRQTFAEIRKVRPRYLYVAADGPRPDRPEDVQKCWAARQVLDEVDWDCEVKTLFRDVNRGCGWGPAEAITWFFEQVEQGIILEDDCLAAPSFFEYCEALLDTYRQDETVYMISGTNPLKKWKSNRASYHFTYMGNSLGWATWRRAWKCFDYQISPWGTEEGKAKIAEVLGNAAYYEHFHNEFEKIYTMVPDDVWDFQWLFARWSRGGKTIVPSVNLISNIGFNQQATHSTNESDLMANLPLYNLPFPLCHPSKKLNKFYDWIIFERFISQKPRTLRKKIFLKIVKVFLSIN